MVHDQEESPRGGGGGGNGIAKKPKMQKAPPQRGLGVAQLEKILRDQDQKTNNDNKSLTEIYSCLMGSPPHPYHPPPTPPPLVAQAMPPLMTPTNNLPSVDYTTRHFPVVDNFDHLIPPLPKLSGSGGGGGGGGVYETGGSARILPSHGESYSDGEGFKFSSGFHFPMHFPEKISGIVPSPPVLPTKHCQYQPWVIASGMNQQIEPPSNQISYNCTSIWPEEEKTVGIKRRWPFTIDDDQTDPLSSCGYGITMGFEPNKPALSFRDLKKEVQPKPNPLKGDTNCGTLDANFLTLGLPATPSHHAETFSDEFCGSYSFPLQESIDESPQSSRHSGSSHGKPFYSFIPTTRKVGWTETSKSFIERRGQAGGDDGVDLNLKLSVGSFNEHQLWHFSKEAGLEGI